MLSREMLQPCVRNAYNVIWRTDCLAAVVSFRLSSHTRQRGVDSHLNSRMPTAV